MANFFRNEFTVPERALDQYGHVNNVVYVQWMQDVAVLHSDAAGWTEATHSIGAAWVARSHTIEYLRPAFAGDHVMAVTWITEISNVTSHRKYRFIRKSDNAVLAKGETRWVFIDQKTGQPRMIPREVLERFLPLTPSGGP